MDVRPSPARRFRVWCSVVMAALMLAALPAAGGGGNPSAVEAGACPPGYVRYADVESSELRGRRGAEGAALSGLSEQLAGDLCINQNHPESPLEATRPFIDNQREMLAPLGAVKGGAFKSALTQAQAIRRAGTSNPAWANGWKSYGKGPLNSDDPDYTVSQLGNGDVAGRISDLEYVPETGTLYASKSTGGVWKSTNRGKSWRSIGDKLPTQVIGSVAWSPVNGGTVYALSGDGSFGRYSYEGFGLYWSTNDGRTWVRAKGTPDEAMGFKVAVDPTNPREVYAATGAGLYRSTDGGRSFKNAKLPTGACAGKSNRVKGCLLANVVTDVVVQTPGGITEVPGGVVVAAVGWRDGNDVGEDGNVESPGNGIYISPTGTPGSFTKSAAPGFAPQDMIGRTELGAAYGPDQDHNYLYAIVQDALIFQDTTSPEVDLPEGSSVPYPTVLNGVYVSSDFGQTWRVMATGQELQQPGSGSSLVVVTQASGVGPGVQAWFNMWIQPDPTAADPALGVPTRLLFGLEEVWQNELPVPQNGKSQFKVVGRYFSGESCLFVSPLPACPTDRTDALEFNTTTHPDQHMGTYIPNRDGTVTLVAGNDGGVYTQTIDPGAEYVNTGWGNGSNTGFNTLLPYHAVMARDGTVWMGLQDNGTAKIEPKRGYRQVMTLGGDGFYVAVDPENSKVAIAEYTYGAMSATTNGGKSWSSMSPPITNAQFSNPFVMDPTNPRHIVTAGRQVVETGSGAGAGSLDWKTVFDLGTQDHPGDPTAQSPEDPESDYSEDPSNTMTAIDAFGPNIYVGFCSACDVLDNPNPFRNGIATNVGGKRPPKTGSTNGWHLARAKGLPNRFVTHVAVDPARPRTVYVTLGGYSRRWTPPGMLGQNDRIGKGHVYVSTDAGATFRNISANLPDVRHTWIEPRGDELVVASDVGVFVRKKNGTNWAPLGKGLPGVPIHSIEVAPHDLNLLVAATHGRGVWTYRFGPPRPYRYGKPIKPFPKPGAIKGTVLAGPFGFETGDEGWTTAQTGDHEFRRQPPGDASAFSFAVLPYRDESSASLTSPAFTHRGGTVELSWSELRDTESCCDYVTVDWSSDGLQWNTIEAFAGLNEGFPAFSPHAVKFWAPKGSIYVRFRISSDQLVSFPANQGIAIDNVTLKV